MTNSDVPAASSSGSPRASTRAGTTRNSPPTPRNPVSSPTTVAVTSTSNARGHVHENRVVDPRAGSWFIAPGVGASVRGLTDNHHRGHERQECREHRHQGRLPILGRLCRGPATVGELSQAVEMEQSAVSHQSRLLRNLGLVEGEREGRSIRYALYDHHVAELLERAVFHTEHLRLGAHEGNTAVAPLARSSSAREVRGAVSRL